MNKELRKWQAIKAQTRLLTRLFQLPLLVTLDEKVRVRVENTYNL